jgi:hypothetical protein
MHIDSISTPSARVTAYKSSSYVFLMMIGAIPPITTKNTFEDVDFYALCPALSL